MDLEELSKSQIILLTLLVSFVTSIATGIVTVSLMDQAPPAIAQTVNRIVERTVEKVVPSAEGQTASVVTTEKTVVVKESDLIVQAVEKMTPSLVRVYTNVTKDPAFLGLGVVIDNNGSIAVDGGALSGISEALVVLSDGSSVEAALATSTWGGGISILKAASTTSEGAPAAFSPATLSTTQPVLGTTIVVLSGKSIPRITDGLVTALIPHEGSEPIIDTNISADFVTGGSPLINTDGALVGISTALSRVASQSGFIPSSVLVSKHKGPETDSE